MSTYKLVVNGHVLPGHDVDIVKGKAASMFKMANGSDKLNALFSGVPITVKRGLTEAQGNSYVKAIRGAGLSCDVALEALIVEEPFYEEEESTAYASVASSSARVRPVEPVSASPENGSITEQKPESETQTNPGVFDVLDDFEPAVNQANEGSILEAFGGPDQPQYVTEDQTIEPSETAAAEPPSVTEIVDDEVDAERNPYQQPEAELEVVSGYGAQASLVAPKRCAAGEGLFWLQEGVAHFKLNPWVWLANTVVFFTLFIIISITPIVSLFSGLLIPVFSAGFILASYKLHKGESFGVGQVFAGFKRNFGGLLAVGAFYSLGMALIIVGALALMFFVGGGVQAFAGIASADQQMSIPILLVGLLAVIAMVPLLMAVWFAPAIVTIHGTPALQAMRLSLTGCLRNGLPLTLYSLLTFVLMIVATIPLGLGWLVLSPILFSSVFVSYRQIFTDDY